MAASKTRYLQKAIIDHILGKAEFVMPAAVYLCAFTADPGEDGSFADEIPASGTAYARINLSASGVMGETNLTTGISSNLSAISFVAATSDWGAVSHVGVSDNATAGAGNLLYKEAMTSIRTIQTGDSLEFAIGAFQIKEE